jgi:DNA mismatch repair protein MutL
VEVRHLFYNTPARRKFLRAVPTEMGHVSEAFTRLALAHPALHLTLRHNGKPVYEVSSAAGLLDRLGLFFGAEVRGQLYWVEVKQGPATLRGFIGDPACERGNAKMQYLFVNGRCIRDRTLSHALQEAYRGLLMTGRYAVAFLFLEVPPGEVDVNVHPTKAEVRFRDGNALHHLVFSAIRHRLQAENLTARLQIPSSLAAPDVQGLPPRIGTTFALSGTAATAGSSLPFPGPAAHAPSLVYPPERMGRTAGQNLVGAAAPQVATGSEVNSRADSVPGAVLPPPGTFKAIQLYDAYLVLETPEGMLVIDQHALHERILFEQLKQRLHSGPLEAQRLLIPEPVDLSAGQAARALEHCEALAELGLGIEDFGGGTLLLTSYPALLGRRAPQDILRAVVDHIVANERAPSREQLLNDLLSLMACHAAVRAGDRLTSEEIAALVAQRDAAGDTHHCPHGRPTALLFSRHDLERQFRRV